MRQEVAEQLCEALRSDKYKQTSSRLRDGDRFCCLGVLCDISGLHEWEEDGTYGGNEGILPWKVMEWAGMSTAGGNVVLNGELTCLAELNDSGMAFTNIADIIEEGWRNL